MGAAEPDDQSRWRDAFAVPRLADDASLADSLRRVAVAGCTLVDSCAGASLTLIGTGRPTTIAATNVLATELDQVQYDQGEGPCLTAAREERRVIVDVSADHSPYRVFREAARANRVTSTISVPLQLNDAVNFGALNLYSITALAIPEHDVDRVEQFAGHASALVANALAYWKALSLTQNLTIALERRGVIDQAKGILMATRHCTADEAFDVLRTRSQAENRKLRAIASELVADATGDRGA